MDAHAPLCPGRRASDSQACCLRVALLTNFIAPYRVELLETLAARFGELRVFVSTLMEPDRAWTPRHGTLRVILQRSWTVRAIHRRAGGLRQALFIHLPWDTLPLLLAWRPQLVISGELGLRSLLAGVHRRLRPHSRLIVWATLSEHTERDWGWVRRLLRRAILAQADAVLVNGGSGARYIAAIAPRARTHVVHQPVPLDRLLALDLARSPGQLNRLVFCGRLIALKGVFELQRAIAAWAARHPNTVVELTWAGDGVAGAALRAAVLPANVSQIFAGHLDDDALLAVYATSGALVLPTLMDEWGLVVNEALGAGLPVLGSIFSQAVEELVQPGRCGWLFDPTDPAAFASVLDSFLTAGPARLAEMRAAARDRGRMVTVAGTADRILRVATHLFNTQTA